MQVSDLKLLGLPVLEAQAKVQSALLDSVYSILRSKRLSLSLSLHIVNDLDEGTGKTFYFPTPEQIPGELIAFLEEWARRIAGERNDIEAAIEQLKMEQPWCKISQFSQN